jgi:hypothetical protein
MADMVEYGGGRQRGFILASEGRGGKGWRSFTSELRSVVQFFQSLYSGGPAGVRSGGCSSLGLGESGLVRC